MANIAHDPRFSALRQQAERALSRHDADTEHLSRQAIQELFHELRVHQIELQLQNEELQDARRDAEAQRDRFAELYDSVPVGCLTVNREGVIREANRSGCLLLVESSSPLVGRRLDEWVSTEDQDTYFLSMRRLFQTGRQQGRLSLLRSEAERWVAQIEARVVTTGLDTGQTCRLVLSDITAQHQADVLRAQRDWLDVTLSSMGDASRRIPTAGLLFSTVPQSSLPDGWQSGH